MSTTQFVVLLLVIITVVALYVFGTYQELTSLRDRLDKASAQLAALRKRRSEGALDDAQDVAELDNLIASTHQRYTDAVLKYNAYKQKRPTAWVANLTGHRAVVQLQD
ncbi:MULTISPECIES: hypothetical protein [Pseudomonas]|uniref:hypothetical protein n=1 Tax=Pseudomonas TaxID=286 RepID=UPI000CFC2265|nr:MULTISPECIES: hypothetical protein [Pseudomonas]PQZ84305.1 hypothetical protein CQ048_25130 [Pseudomonas trivialis]PRB20242.1 hypothetical protein CQ041_25195 [Pseudomonas sp. MYb60]